MPAARPRTPSLPTCSTSSATRPLSRLPTCRTTRRAISSNWLRDRKNRRQIPYRFERCGYVPVRNDVAKDGLWTVKRVRQVIYARTELTARARREVAAKRAGQ